MEITPRIKQIITNLIDAEEPLSDQRIADSIGVSRRTVLREMDYLGSVLESFGLELVVIKGEGREIKGSDDDKKALRERLLLEGNDTGSDKEQRRNFLKLELLRNSEPKKLFYFSNVFGVSEATVSTDLDAIEGWAEENHLSIIRKPGMGIMLSGTEKNYRAALQRYVTENFRCAEREETADNIYSLLNEAIFSEVQEILDEIDEPYLKRITNEAYIGLLVHISIAVERIRKGEFVDVNNYDARYDKGYDLAKKIAEALETAFDISLPESEVNNILLHIRGAKLKFSNEAMSESSIQAEELIAIVNEMIDSIESDYAAELKYEDDFIRALILHMQPALYRMKNELPITNPFLSEIKTEYPEVYADCEKAAEVVYAHTGLKINPDETGYLAMHFGAAKEKIERRRRKRRTVNVGVVCASGFGVSNLMVAKLRSQLSSYDVNLKAYGFDEITPHILSKVDFFVSGMNVSHLDADYIVVSPLITHKDLLQIGLKIDEYSTMPRRQEENDFSKQLDEINDFVTKIRGIIKRYHHIVIDREVNVDSLIKALSMEITDAPQAAAVLYADLSAREKSMSQIFPEIGLALFHCRSRAVKNCQIITAGYEREGIFNDEKLKGIKAVMVMIMPLDDERKENAEMLGRISSAIIEDEAFLRSIHEGDEDAIRNKLQKILKQYFSEHINRF